MLDARTKLIHLIEQRGPISIANYMNLCLFDPEYGYYRTHSPIGRAGDFTTAPEISQLFGEMIGLWILNQWEQSTQANLIALVELGPGRGTLMSDLLRTTLLRPNFVKNLTIHLLEINPVLIALQKERLKNHMVTWYHSLEALLRCCVGKLTFVIANEFFDVFPIQQYIYQGQWFERLISYDRSCNQFSFVQAQQPTALEQQLTQYPTPKTDDIFEISTQASLCFSQLLTHISRNNGGILLIDYGYTQPLYGDSLQASQRHRYVDVFSNPGKCDLTTHVNFWRLLQNCNECALQARLTSQSQFLMDLGIQTRAAQLLRNKTVSIQKQIHADFNRLISANEMGQLFKVLEIYAR